MFALLFWGCRTPEDERMERVEKADRYFSMIKYQPVPTEKIFTLSDCIETALKNNLDLRVFAITEKINQERTSSAYLSMLPDLYVTYDLTSRSNEPGAESISLKTNTESLEPSRSTEKTVGEVKVELAFSLVDFGLSYLTAVQSEDKARLTLFQRQRASQNLSFDVARSYYRVAAAQYARDNTEKLLELSKVVEKNLDYIAQTKTLSPLKTLAEKKQILKLKQSLSEYNRVYENSCIELKTLMGYAPWSEIQVDTSCFEEFKPMSLPHIDILEQVAIRKRPELYQIDTQTHISLLEARKKILSMFPNVKMFLDFTHSSNSLLYNLSWWEIGIRCAYHLLRLPEQIKEWRALDMEIDESEARTLALTSGIMAQVRIAHANLVEVENRYSLSELIYSTHLSQLKVAKEEAKAGGRISQIELFKMAMETANTSIERSQQLGNYYLAHFRLLNAVGLDSMDDLKNAETILNDFLKQVEDEQGEPIQPYDFADTDDLRKNPETGRIEKTEMIREDDGQPPPPQAQDNVPVPGEKEPALPAPPAPAAELKPDEAMLRLPVQDTMSLRERPVLTMNPKPPLLLEPESETAKPVILPVPELASPSTAPTPASNTRSFPDELRTVKRETTEAYQEFSQNFLLVRQSFIEYVRRPE
jgi:outer membrane protein TolC